MSRATLNDNASQHRFELIDEGQVVGFAEYSPAEDAITLVHTEIGEGHEGKGYGSALAKGVLEEMRSRNRQVIPVCEFMAGYIRKHPQYLDVVEPNSRRTFQTDA